MAEGSDSFLKGNAWVLQVATVAFAIGGAWVTVGYRIDSLHEKDQAIDRRLDNLDRLREQRGEYLTSMDRRLYQAESTIGRHDERITNLDSNVTNNRVSETDHNNQVNGKLDKVLGWVRK